MRRKCVIVILSFLLLLPLVYNDEIQIQNQENQNTDIAPDHEDKLLLFATLEGSLIAIEQRTGKIRWKIKDKAMVQVPLDTSNAIVPIFLPDPRDGSLYLLGNSREPLKKLPFTIPQLVASSPCRSTDGILYTGRKKDTWFKLDPLTGNKEQVLGWGISRSPTCPLTTNQFVYIGRTKYEVMMVDSRNSQRKWNVTYYDYTATSMSKDEINNYDLVHFASTSTGRLITLDRRRGSLLWDGDLGSPIVGAYILDTEGLISVPYTSLANHTVTYLVNKYITDEGIFQNPTNMKLYPTLYVGEHVHGLYAIPSLVDQNVVTITSSEDGLLMLGGPYSPEAPKLYPEYPLPGHNYKLPKNLYNDGSINFQSMPNFGNHIIIYTGHYNVPEYSDKRFMVSERAKDKPINLITDESKLAKPNQKPKHNSIGIQTEKLKNIEEELKTSTFKHYYKLLKIFINQQENKGLKMLLIVLVGCVVAMFFYMQMQVREFQNLSQSGSKSSQQGSMGRHGTITALPEELPDGLVRVGKITFHPEELLGKGCEGTFVYRGEFDSRKVAVKRLLPECFTFADREVALLRESDAHPNVIRYYCMEQDRLFRYIALELCQATLSEYIQSKCDTSTIKPLDILQQATSGLAHLHSLDIVHRDIKPHNVLLSMPSSRGEVRAMISDFGLCKKLKLGRMSFSRRSGVTGTDGWIAPEMLDGNERTTCAVDLFSLGCLFYYVLSNGAHPFGDALRRQANILGGEFKLDQLKNSDWQINVEIPLISALISSDPEIRPSCVAVLAHPMFWSCSKILSFFQDVSDRVEKCEPSDDVLLSLEKNSEPIVQNDWRYHIHEEVAKDLRKYRSYRGDSVRDLLRALRNKKHHFRELSREAQETLGEIPEAFTHYWTTRFPLLLVHAWITMQCVAEEKTFSNYYHGKHRYSLEEFNKQVGEYLAAHPVNVPIEDVLKQRSNANGAEGFDYFTNKSSPSRKPPKITFADQRMGQAYSKAESVGLYRNLGAPVNVNDVQVNFKDNSVRKRNARAPRKKKSDEPLVWAVRE